MLMILMCAFLSFWLYQWRRVGRKIRFARQLHRERIGKLSPAVSQRDVEAHDRQAQKARAVVEPKPYTPKCYGKSWCNVRRPLGELRRLVQQDDGAVAEFTLRNGVPGRLVETHEDWRSALCSVR